MKLNCILTNEKRIPRVGYTIGLTLVSKLKEEDLINLIKEFLRKNEEPGHSLRMMRLDFSDSWVIIIFSSAGHHH